MKLERRTKNKNEHEINCHPYEFTYYVHWNYLLVMFLECLDTRALPHSCFRDDLDKRFRRLSTLNVGNNNNDYVEVEEENEKDEDEDEEEEEKNEDEVEDEDEKEDELNVDPFATNKASLIETQCPRVYKHSVPMCLTFYLFQTWMALVSVLDDEVLQELRMFSKTPAS
ncbi:hypothetical protein M0802_000812 [Mischocyttarus mexicanus]|nr:hypothetical protein M0802_000812 [Mischocyttarus mexicanus]